MASRIGAEAMVLAAGLGSRLRPLTDQLPKPCVPFLNEPLLFRCLRVLANLGHRKVVVNTSYQQSVLKALCAQLPDDLPQVVVSAEEFRLGTGGGVRYASHHFTDGEPIIAMNGDVVSGMDLKKLVEIHKKSAAWATLAVFRNANFPDALHKVSFDADGNVVSLDGVSSSTNHNAVVGRSIYTGTLVMSPDFISALPTGREACLKEDGFWPGLISGNLIKVYETSAYWSDVGTPLRYLQTHMESLQNRTCVPVGDYTEIKTGVWVHKTARIHQGVSLGETIVIGPNAVIEQGVTLQGNVVLGKGAQVSSGTNLSNAVLWDGTRCSSGLVKNVVIHSGGTLDVKSEH